MQKTIAVYSSKSFIVIVFIALLSLLILNYLFYIKTHNAIFTIPIVVQSILLILIVIKSKFVKIALKIWAMTLLLAGIFALLSIFFTFMSMVSQNFTGFWNKLSPQNIGFALTQIIVGFYIFFSSNRYIHVLTTNTGDKR